jgi:hypothetical protein
MKKVLSITNVVVINLVLLNVFCSTFNPLDLPLLELKYFNGFNLRTLKSMKEDSNGNEKTFIYYQDKTPRIGNDIKEAVSDYYRILYLTQHKQQDYFELVQDGAVINQVSVFDIINKEVITKKFNYNESANSTFVLGSKTAYPNYALPFIAFTQFSP